MRTVTNVEGSEWRLKNLSEWRLKNLSELKRIENASECEANALKLWSTKVLQVEKTWNLRIRGICGYVEFAEARRLGG